MLERKSKKDSDKHDFFASLNPLKKGKNLREMGFYTFDCETEDGLIGKKLYCWGLGFREKGGKNELISLQGYKSFDLLFNRLNEWKGKHYKIVYVHNLTFDARFLINYMANNEIDYYPIISGSNFLALVIDELKVKFIDSVQFLKTSQEKAEIEWNVDKKYTKINCDDLWVKDYEKWSKEDKIRVFEHNSNDVKALHQIMTNFRKTMWEISSVDCLNVVSLAGLAMKAFRKEMKVPMLNPFVYFRVNKETKRLYLDYDDIAERFIRASYYGGRCEVYDRHSLENMKYMDKVSMYPGVMTQKLYPNGSPSWATSSNDDKKLLMRIIKDRDRVSGIDGSRFALISVKVKPNVKEYYPVLPTRINGKVMYPNVEFEGIFTSVELQYAYKRGYRFEINPISIKSIKLDNVGVSNVCGLVFPDKADYFLDFVGKFFKIKSESKGGKREASKIILNSSYGKFGQRFLQKTTEVKYFVNEMDMLEYQRFHEYPNKLYMKKNKESRLWITNEIIESERVKPFMNISIATFITSYSRLELIMKIHEMENDGVMTKYCDTDSLTIRDDAKVELSKNLGGWDIEQYFDEVKFLAPKAYIFIKNNIPALKLKGVNKRKIKEILSKVRKRWEKDNSVDMMLEIEKLIRKPIEMAERYTNFRESHRNGLILGSKKPCKNFSFKNDKRWYSKEGFSEAWNKDNIPEVIKNGILKLKI